MVDGAIHHFDAPTEDAHYQVQLSSLVRQVQNVGFKALWSFNKTQCLGMAEIMRQAVEQVQTGALLIRGVLSVHAALLHYYPGHDNIQRTTDELDDDEAFSRRRFRHLATAFLNPHIQCTIFYKS